MEEIAALEGMDIYLMDQIFRGNISKGQRILDAGCGAGRNMRFFLENDFNVSAFDPKEPAISHLREQFPDKANAFHIDSLEQFSDPDGFDYIICNAVLHFANDHVHFNSMFKGLVSLMRPNATLFIRMTSDIGINLNESETGVYRLPDGSTRYCVTRKQIDKLMTEHNLQLDGPVKTVKVEELRSMTMMVFRKR